jgi:hypothetical protein
VPEELPALLCPGLPAFRQSVSLLIGHGAALRELRCKRIGDPIGGRRRIYLIFVAAKPNCAGGDNQDNEYYCSHGREAFEFFRVH